MARARRWLASRKTEPVNYCVERHPFALSPYTLETQSAEKITRPRAPATSLFSLVFSSRARTRLAYRFARRISFSLPSEVFVYLRARRKVTFDNERYAGTTWQDTTWRAISILICNCLHIRRDREREQVVWVWNYVFSNWKSIQIVAQTFGAC